MNQKILGTGLSGLVGSRVVELLSSNYEFEDLSIDTGVDITNKKQIEDAVSKSSASWILHFAALTDVDFCESERKKAWKVNVEGTENIVNAAKENNKKILYISTDFIFDGTRAEYSEEDRPNPINYYAKTKYEGEKIVKKYPNSSIIRITYPFRAYFPTKKDFVRAIIEKLKNNKYINAPFDNIFTPTFIDDIAQALEKLIIQGSGGVFHVVGSTFLSSYEAAIAIADVFGYDKSLVKKIRQDKYYENRAKRPLKLATRNDKIGKLGIKMRTFRQGLEEIKKQQNILR